MAQNLSSEELLKSQTVGLVNLADFRKRRAEIFEQEAIDSQLSRASTPKSSGTSTPKDGDKPAKKKRKQAAKSKLSFAGEDEEEQEGAAISSLNTPRSNTPTEEKDTANGERDATKSKVRLGPNSAVGAAPTLMTKSAQAKRDAEWEQYVRKNAKVAELVKQTEMLLPFVFFEGAILSGGACRVKKGDPIWLFLDLARKVGAQLGVTDVEGGKKDWARVSVDDLMLVRGDLIIPPHLDFYWFISKAIEGFDGLVFDYSSNVTAATPLPETESEEYLKTYNPLSRPSEKSKRLPDEKLEGAQDEPELTKVVDRRWYERNKHLYPASRWEEYDPKRKYKDAIRKDAQGNTFFSS